MAEDLLVDATRLGNALDLSPLLGGICCEELACWQRTTWDRERTASRLAVRLGSAVAAEIRTSMTWNSGSPISLTHTKAGERFVRHLAAVL